MHSKKQQKNFSKTLFSNLFFILIAVMPNKRMSFETSRPMTTIKNVPNLSIINPKYLFTRDMTIKVLCRNFLMLYYGGQKVFKTTL